MEAYLEKIKIIMETISFFSMGDELTKIGIKHKFSFDPVAHYSFTLNGEKYILANKDGVKCDDTDLIVGHFVCGKGS